jgi:transposase
MNSIKDQLTEGYSQVDDFFQTHPQLARQRTSNNHPPKFTDNEVIALGLMQGYFRTADLKRVFLLVVANDARAFSAPISYQQWLHRLHALAPQIQALLAATGRQVYGTACVYLMDSKPIPICLPIRHGRVRLLRDDGAYFGKTSKGWFFGFKLHLIRDLTGRILNVVLTPGNWTDHDAALALGFNVAGGVVIADLGYRGAATQDLLWKEADLLLLTKDDVAAPQRFFLSQLRQGVETTFSQLWRELIDRVGARSWHGLWNTTMLKLLHFQWTQTGRLTP